MQNTIVFCQCGLSFYLYALSFLLVLCLPIGYSPFFRLPVLVFASSYNLQTAVCLCACLSVCMFVCVHVCLSVSLSQFVCFLFRSFSIFHNSFVHHLFSFLFRHLFSFVAYAFLCLLLVFCASLCVSLFASLFVSSVFSVSNHLYS